MVNTVSAAAAVCTGNNLLQSMMVDPESSNEKSSDKNSEENPDVAKPISANQISANVVEITFDIPVEKEHAIKVGNYWVRSTQEEKPTGIATVGKNEKIKCQ